jgi:TolB-like protein/tetratricopeptide (TPR) repeat protein
LAVFMVGGALAYRTLAPSGDDPGAETAYEASIGVLRFRTVDGTPEDQRAADAIADAIIDWVAEWQRQCETQPEVYQGTCDARVAPREKSFAHTLENESVDAVGSALDVAFLIDGALQRFGDRQHVTVRIHRVATGELMYAYEDDAAGDPIRLVGTVTARVLPALRVVIGKPGDEYSLASMREDGTRSIDAYQAALDGVNVIQRPDLAHAAALFREAIRLDPSYVRAYGNLATVLLLQAEMSPLSDRASALEEIAQIRAQVARLDPGANVLNEIAMAQSRVGNARLVDQEAQLSGFIRLADSSDAIAFYDDYGQLLFGAHLFDEAEQYVRQNERSRAFDFTTSRVLITIARERPQLAAALLDRALLAWPNDVRLLSWAVPQLARRGDWDEAESCLAHLEQIDRDGIWSYTARVQFAVLRGDLPAGSEALSAALAHEHSTPLLRGAVRFMLGDVDGGVAEWRGMDAALVGLLGRDGPVTETLFPEAVLADLRYQDLLDELGVGRQWTAYLRDRVEALAPITGIHPAPITPAIVSSG